MIRRQLGAACARLGAPALFTLHGDSARLQPILVDFSSGIGCGLEGVGADELQSQEDAIIWYRRSFFREGYALALAARTAFLNTGSPETRNRARTPFRMMHYTGYGFWNGCAETLPLPRLAESGAMWANVDDYAMFYPFLVGGRSFGRVIRAGAVTVELIRSYEREATPALMEAAWHGLGRGFWFREPGRPEQLLDLLAVYPPARDALLIGLGFAMTYTQISTPAVVLQTLRSMPADMALNLRIGGGIALAALVHEIPEEGTRIHASYDATELGSHFADAIEAERVTPRDKDWYERFNANLARIRDARPLAV